MCLTLKNVESKQRLKMKKTEDQDLLELQKLSLYQITVNRQKTLEEIQVILNAHLLNHVPVLQLSKEFCVGKSTIYRWISTFANGKLSKRNSPSISHVKQNPSIMPKKNPKPVETEAEELARLREENKRLAEALKMAEWMNHAKDVMIDEAEKTFKIPIRKKSGAKQ